MAIFKRGGRYWYHFYFDGQHIQESTKQGNPQTAREKEAERRAKLARERDERAEKSKQLQCEPSDLARCPGCDRWFDTRRAQAARDGQRLCDDECRTKWNKQLSPVPTLREFCEKRIEPWARAEFMHTSVNTWRWYRAGLRTIYDYAPLADLSL